MAECIGVRGEIVGCDINGDPFYNMYLTDTEVTRCRDCRASKREGLEKCPTFEAHGRDPNGFCAWAERDE